MVICRLQRSVSALLVADANGLIDPGQEDFAVSDFAGGRGLDDGFNRRVNQVIGDHQLDLDLGQQIDVVFAAAIDLGVAFLASMTAHL
jgi:hypothetical protein